LKFHFKNRKLHPISGVDVDYKIENKKGRKINREIFSILFLNKKFVKPRTTDNCGTEQAIYFSNLSDGFSSIGGWRGPSPSKADLPSFKLAKIFFTS